MPASPQPPDAPALDPLLPTGITLGAIGLLALGGGSAAYLASPTAGDELCGLSGCFTRPDHDLKLGAVALMAGGGALAALSVPVIITGATGSTPARQSDGQMITGVVLTGAGTASVVGGFAAVVAQARSVQAHDNDTEVATVAVPMLLAGGGALAVGLPLWIAGGEDWAPPTVRAPDAPVAPGEAMVPEGVYVQRSTAMKTTGIVVTIMGGVMGIASAAFIASANQATADCEGECDFVGIGDQILGWSLLVTSGLHLAVGIPLWAVGASDDLVRPDDPRAVKPRDEAGTTRAPTITVGLGSVELDWRF
ncbi:MAG: hypothetical protein DRI90_11730 [Deltaproteobacteria bacterium]|nr:MAG: hypothetical protein DRI90_11730 [Deltaproteobacteria bacterium]